MDQLEFLHGATGQRRSFNYALIEPGLRECLLWAEVHGPEDVRAKLDVQQLAALRAWTGTPMCYVLTDVLRSAERTRQSVLPVLPFARLFFTALHALPERLIFKPSEHEGGILYRAERGVMSTWDAKMRPGGIFSFQVPTSFSQNPAVLNRFKDGSGDRTVFIVHGAAGWVLSELSVYADEDEVLLEPVCNFQVMRAEKFDAHHLDVQMGEVRPGLHRVEGHVRPGVALQEGSRVKEYEAESFRQWQEKLRRHAPDTIPDLKDLVFDPLSEEEWLARGKEVPKTKGAQRMSRLGGGAFGDTYRKKARDADGVGACFAVKVFSVEKMEDLQIREEDVRREASTLGMLRHKNIIRYFGLVETDDEMAIVMELALGGSVANFIAKRANALGAETRELFEILVQTADALDYIHSQGIVHRDIKPENVLLAHAEGPLCIKLADFGVAAVLNTVAGSALMSKTGTLPYFSPERGNEQAYGAMADMWALGVMLIELVTLTRQTRGLWNQGPEVSERRARLLLQVARKDQGLGQLATELLHVDKNCRLSACALKSKLRQQQRQPQEEAPEQTAAAEAKAKAEAAAKREQEEASKQKSAAAAKVAQERTDDELAKKLQMQLRLQAAGSSPAAWSAPSQPPPLSKALPLPTFKPSKSLFSKDVKFCLKCGQGTTKDDRAMCKQCHAAQWVEADSPAQALRALESKLLRAAQDGDTTTAVALLKAGTNVHCRDGAEDTPLHEAARFNRFEVAQVLLAHGADVNARNSTENTPLHWAAIRNSLEVAQVLLAHGADVNARDKSERTPLHEAAYRNSLEVAQVLLAHGADVNARDKEEWAPLHCAAAENSLEVAQVLLAHGADVKTCNKNGKTPVAIAKIWCKREVEALLRQHGGH